MSKKKPRPRTRTPGALTDYEDAKKELRAHGPRARWALDELERLAKGESTYGALPPTLVILCLKEILAYEGLPKALQFKAAEGISGDTTVVIQVAAWAAGPQRQQLPSSAPALPEVIFDADAVRTNGTPPTPPMSEQTRLQKIVNAARPTPIYEVPADPSKPKKLVGEMSQAKGYLSREEIFRRLTKGRPQNEDRTQNEDHQMLFPNLQRDD